MNLKTSRNCHALYNLEYHVIFVTKYRKKCISEPVYQSLKRQIIRIAELNGAEIEDIAHEEDHVHILMSVPPQVCLSEMINAMKSTSSRIGRRDHKEYLSCFYWKPYFWSRSYLILSSGGAPIEVIQKYIDEQGTPEHAAKKAGRAAITT